MSPEQVVVDARQDTAIALIVEQKWYAALEEQNESVQTEVHTKYTVTTVAASYVSPTVLISLLSESSLDTFLLLRDGIISPESTLSA